MEICRPFAPILGADIINEKHEKISCVFTDANNGGGEYGNTLQVSKDRRILEKYPILKEILLNKFYGFIKESNLNYNNKFDISTSWLTKSENKQQCVKHSHKNCFYSGVYYYGDRYDSNCGDLILITPLNALTDFVLQPENEFGINPQPGGVIFFPSYIQHKFNSNYSNNPRYSLAFNIVPLGFYGEGDSSYDTSWFN